MCAADGEQEALDVAMEHTLRFVERALPVRVARVLEIGCGDGRLARRMNGRADELIAIDVDPACVAAARARGVDARVADWMTFDGGCFDAILFTRSLHHIAPLEAAVDRAAHHLLQPGTLIVEDFAFAEIAPTPVGWLCGVGRALRDEGVVDLSRSSFVAELLASDEPLEVWRRHHGSDGNQIHTADAMSAAIRARFAGVHEESAPYLYRYLCGVLSGPDAAENAARLLDSEKQWIRRGGMVAFGRRWIASGPSAARSSIE